MHVKVYFVLIQSSFIGYYFLIKEVILLNILTMDVTGSNKIIDDIYVIKVYTAGLDWFNLLTPEVVVVQISKNSSEEYIEKTWSQTYVQNGTNKVLICPIKL